MTTPSPLQQAFNEAERLLDNSQLPKAERIYRNITARHPEHHPAWHGLGLIAFKAGKLPLAVKLIGKAIQLAPEAGLYQRNIGEIYRRLGRLEEALSAGREATKLTPGDAESHYNLALALADQGELEAAITSYQSAVKTDPKHAMAFNNLGSLYSEEGKFKEARRCYERAIKARPRFVDAHYNLSSLKTYREGDEHLHALESLVNHNPQLPPQATAKLNFALAKSRQDLGQYDAAFAAFAEANRLQHSLQPYNEKQMANSIAHIKQQFRPTFLQNVKGTGCEDSTPIFIVGMPRSSTTLTEQILASHPGVHGAGEIGDLTKVMMSQADPDETLKVAKLTSDQLNLMGQAYIERIRKLAPDAAHITNKMPTNFLYIGLIRLILPNAKIIHTRRNPVDTCLSCYTKLFSRTMEFTYDLGTLGRYYQRYAELMEYWHSVLPQGTILDVCYEDTVADIESQARRLLDFVGLPWDEACLEFHKTKRSVRTASVTQVRQPVYTSSVERWRRYEKHLTPLLDALGEYAPERG